MEFSPERTWQVRDRMARIYLDIVISEYRDNAYRPLETREEFFERVYAEINVDTKKEAFMLGALAEGMFIIAPEVLDLPPRDEEEEEFGEEKDY
jgi:hypothetical protein